MLVINKIARRYKDYSFNDFINSSHKFPYEIANGEIKFISHQVIVGTFELTEERKSKLTEV